MGDKHYFTDGESEMQFSDLLKNKPSSSIQIWAHCLMEYIFPNFQLRGR